jgi:hypothetical protein
MRILFAVLISSLVSSAAAGQVPDPKPFTETVKVISETKESIRNGSTTTTKRVSPVIPCNLKIQVCQDKLQSVFTKSNVQSYYQAKVQVGDMLYTINGRSGAPGLPFGTFKGKITNDQYIDIYIVDQNGPYVLGFEIVGSEKIDPQSLPAPLLTAGATQQTSSPNVAQCRSALNRLSALHTDADIQGLFVAMTAGDEMVLSTSLASCVNKHSDVLDESEIARLNLFCYKLDADVMARMWDFIERRHLADAFNDEQEANKRKK